MDVTANAFRVSYQQRILKGRCKQNRPFVIAFEKKACFQFASPSSSPPKLEGPGLANVATRQSSCRGLYIAQLHQVFWSLQLLPFSVRFCSPRRWRRRNTKRGEHWSNGAAIYPTAAAWCIIFRLQGRGKCRWICEWVGTPLPYGTWKRSGPTCVLSLCLGLFLYREVIFVNRAYCGILASLLSVYFHFSTYCYFYLHNLKSGKATGAVKLANLPPPPLTLIHIYSFVHWFSNIFFCLFGKSQ